jgi:hypothetical protein
MNNLSQYLAIQPLMRTGDLIEWKGNSLISKAIMQVTGNNVSHSSMVVLSKITEEDEERRYIIEAVRYGVCWNYLSDVLNHYDGTAYWYQLKPEYDHLRSSMGSWLWNEYRCDKHYDFGGIIKRYFGKVSLDARRWFCSEICEACLINFGILAPLENGVRDPGDFTKEGIFNAKARIL